MFGMFGRRQGLGMLVTAFGLTAIPSIAGSATETRRVAFDRTMKRTEAVPRWSLASGRGSRAEARNVADRDTRARLLEPEICFSGVAPTLVPAILHLPAAVSGVEPIGSREQAVRVFGANRVISDDFTGLHVTDGLGDRWSRAIEVTNPDTSGRLGKMFGDLAVDRAISYHFSDPRLPDAHVVLSQAERHQPPGAGAPLDVRRAMVFLETAERPVAALFIVDTPAPGVAAAISQRLTELGLHQMEPVVENVAARGATSGVWAASSQFVNETQQLLAVGDAALNHVFQGHDGVRPF